MKNKILIIASLLCTASHAQVWIGLGGGYGMPLGSQTIYWNQDMT